MRYGFIVVILFISLKSYAGAEPAKWEIEQLTQCSAGKVFSPHISADGKTIYFLSNCDFIGENRDKNFEIFKWENESISQITDDQYCKISSYDVSLDGKKIVFSNNCQLSGKNESRGTEIAFMDENGVIEVLTEGNGFISKNPSWSVDGKWIVFESSLNPGMNPDNSQEVFAVNIQDKKVIQLSLTIAPGKCEQPSMVGKRTIAVCNDDLLGIRNYNDIDSLTVKFDERKVVNNPDKNTELFFLDIGGEIKQITKTRKCEMGLIKVHPLGRGLSLTTNCSLVGEPQIEKGWKLYYYASDFTRLCPGYMFNVSSMGWSMDAKKLAISSTYFTQKINIERNREIFLIDVENPENKPEIVTDYKTGSSITPVLNEDGTIVVFVSTNNETKNNDDRSPELFMAKKVVYED